MHFSVLVVGKDKDDVIGQLEYYSEDREVESYLNVPFDDVVDDVLDRYESEYKGLIEKTKSDPNYVPPAYKKGDLDRFLEVDFTAPEEEVREKLYELFAKDWGNDVREDGVYSSYNPEGQWDWYQLGGRFTGSLLLSDFAVPIKGYAYPSNYNVVEKMYEMNSRNRADFARLDDVVNIRELLSNGIYSLLSPSTGWVDLDGKSEDDLDFYYKKILDNKGSDDVVAIIDCHS